jgi:CzcA family heavy metal efflux pump
MLNNIIKYSLENRLLVMFLALVLIVGGGYMSSKVEIDVFPDLTAPSVAILTEAHGMATEDVETMITFPLETAVNGAPNVRRVRSKSTAGFSIVWVDFDWGMDQYKARQIVSEKLASIREILPEGARDPVLAPQSSIMGEIMLVVLQSEKMSPMELRTIADWNVAPRLLSINGVSQVISMGGDVKQFQILLDPHKLKFYNITLAEVMEVCKNMNANVAGGVLNEFGQEYSIRGMGRTNKIEDLSNTLIKHYNGNPVKLNDIAEIKVGPREPKIGDAFHNEQAAVVMTIMRQPNVNTVELTEKIDFALEDLKKSLPESISINSHVFRQSDFITTSVNNVTKSLLEGAIFVIVILFLFLMNYKTTIISVIAIPISLIISILTIKFMGFSINTMSLGGMAIAIGDLVDDAIIDVENVLKRLKENHQLAKKERRPRLRVIYEASIEIRSSIIHATFIIIVAFIPLFFLSGMEGRMLRPLGITFIISLFASLLVALSITPVLCSFLLKGDKQLNKPISGGNVLVGKLNEAYKILLKNLLQYKKLMIGIPVILFIIALFILLNFGRSFLPKFNEGVLTLVTTTVPGTSIEETGRLNSLVTKYLLELPEVDQVTRRTGRAEMSEHAHGGSNTSEIDVPFNLKDRNLGEFMDAVREKLTHLVGLSIVLGQPLSHRIDHMLSGTRAQIALKIFGKDIGRMYELANKIKSKISAVEGLVDINVEQLIEVPQIQISPRREMLAKYGISMPAFNEFVNVAFAGEQISNVFEGNQRFKLLIRFNQDSRSSINNIKNALIDTDEGKKIPFSMVADIISASGPITINRENVQRKLVLSANVSGRDLRGVVNDIQKIVNDQVKIPENYFIEYGGQFKSEAKASKMLSLTSLLAILVIFLLLYQEFKSLRLASIIMLNLPLAMIGGVLSIYLSSSVLSIPAIIGFITLFGIATRNGILLISRYQNLESSGLSLIDIVVKGSSDRLNPILMTALTAALALIPLVIYSDRPGNEIQSPMAVVILGGLITSTLLNLFVIPAVYMLSGGGKVNKISVKL